MRHWIWQVIMMRLTGQKDFYNDLLNENKNIYNSYLYNEGPKSALKVKEINAEFANDAPTLNAFEILNKYFDEAFAHNPKLIAFGEDVGQIGDVNQGFSGLQLKYGAERFLIQAFVSSPSWGRDWSCDARFEANWRNTIH